MFRSNKSEILNHSSRWSHRNNTCLQKINNIRLKLNWKFLKIEIWNNTKHFQIKSWNMFLLISITRSRLIKSGDVYSNVMCTQKILRYQKHWYSPLFLIKVLTSQIISITQLQALDWDILVVKLELYVLEKFDMINQFR